MKTLLVILILISLSNLINCEVFSSTDGLVKLLENGNELVKSLEYLTEDLEVEIEALKRKITSTNSELSIMKENPQEYVNNPLNAFIIIKILSHDVDNIQSSLNDTFNSFNNSTENFKLPYEDFEGAVDGFVRLQTVYELKSEDLADGVIDGIKIRDELSAMQLFSIANEAAKINRTIADEYYKIARERTNEDFEVEILEKMVENYREMGKFKNPQKFIFKEELSQLEDFPELNITKKLLGTHYTGIKKARIYSQACMGKRIKNATETSNLFCKFHSTNSFTKIAPFKLEIVNFSPFVGIFHDIIKDHEINELKKLTSDRLKRAEIDYGNGTYNAAKNRVVKAKFIGDHKSEVLSVITARVSDMSGLDMKYAEPLIVQNYGIGGHFYLHHDYDAKNDIQDEESGNRVATTLFYLSDVKKGGATVFPFLKLYVAPKKGSAVFWLNLSTSGHLEPLTYHAGCPVLIGSKWVANKWLHQFGQEFTRPCELHPMPTEEDNWSDLYFKL